jgi:hypothetical protein
MLPMPKSKSHTPVKKFVQVRSLVSALMLVVDYVIPVNENDAFIFNEWVRVVNQWPQPARELTHAWASQQMLIASDHIVENRLPRPYYVSSLPYQYTFTTDDLTKAVQVLKANNVPPDVNGQYTFAVSRANLDALVIRAVKELPCFEQSILRGAFRILEEQGAEFDDVRTELVGMAFDLANGAGSADMYSLAKYARLEFEKRAALPALTGTQRDIADECEKLCTMLIAKNRKYGDSALNPVHIFSKEPAHVQLQQQIDHKLARIARGDESTEDEDVTRDLIGYLVLYRIALRRRLSDRSESKG